MYSHAASTSHQPPIYWPVPSDGARLCLSITPADLLQDSSSKGSSGLSKLSLAASVLPLDFYELFVALNKLDTAFYTFLSEAWSGCGFPHLTLADVWAPLRDLTSWCLLLLSSVESAIEKAVSSSSSWIWSSILGEGISFIMEKISSPGWA